MTDIFDSKPMNETQVKQVDAIKDKAKQLCGEFELVLQGSPTRTQPDECDRQIEHAKMLLETCVMHAVKAVSRQGQ